MAFNYPSFSGAGVSIDLFCNPTIHEYSTCSRTKATSTLFYRALVWYYTDMNKISSLTEHTQLLRSRACSNAKIFYSHIASNPGVSQAMAGRILSTSVLLINNNSAGRHFCYKPTKTLLVCCLFNNIIYVVVNT